jgi:TolB-like protein/tetratricopeptide (TPR) repeat protein
VVEFRSVVEAVRCATEVQAGLAERNAGVPADNRIDARRNPSRRCGRRVIAGASPAKPRPRDKDLLWLGLAAVLVVALIGAGWFAWRAFSPPPAAVTSPVTSVGEATPARAPPLSMVVLPFANLSGDPAQDSFVDGVTETLTTDLSRISGAFVIGRSTAFTYKGMAADLKQVGHDLNVRYFLEGSVQRSGDRMRVNVQLVEAETGKHIWAERFDKPVADLFALQDEIVTRIGADLSAEVTAVEARRAENAPNPDATDLDFQDRALEWSGITPDNLAKARRFFDRALELDPGHLYALIDSAGLDTMVLLNYMTDDPGPIQAEAEARVTAALAEAPDNPFAHWVHGVLLSATKRTSQGIEEIERAIALDPNLAVAYGNLGQAMLWTGWAKETEAQVQKALGLSPRDPQAMGWYVILGASKAFLGEDEQALSWFRQSIEANPRYAVPHFYLAASLANLGRLDEAREETKARLAIDPKFTLARFRAAAQSDNPVFLKQREHIIEGMRLAGVPER